MEKWNVDGLKYLYKELEELRDDLENGIANLNLYMMNG